MSIAPRDLGPYRTRKDLDVEVERLLWRLLGHLGAAGVGRGAAFASVRRVLKGMR